MKRVKLFILGFVFLGTFMIGANLKDVEANVNHVILFGHGKVPGFYNTNIS